METQVVRQRQVPLVPDEDGPSNWSWMLPEPNLRSPEGLESDLMADLVLSFDIVFGTTHWKVSNKKIFNLLILTSWQRLDQETTDFTRRGKYKRRRLRSDYLLRQWSLKLWWHSCELQIAWLTGDNMECLKRASRVCSRPKSSSRLSSL